jgi:hypothetical protein
MLTFELTNADMSNSTIHKNSIEGIIVSNHFSLSKQILCRKLPDCSAYMIHVHFHISIHDFKCRDFFRIILNCAGKMDNVTSPSDVRIQNESQIHQSIEVKNTNDLILEVWHYKPTNHLFR